MKLAPQELKEKYGFKMIQKMKYRIHSKHIKSWDPESDSHSYIEAIKDKKLYKIKVLCQYGQNRPLTTLIKELDYVLCFYWRNEEDYITELKLQI